MLTASSKRTSIAKTALSGTLVLSQDLDSVSLHVCRKVGSDLQGVPSDARVVDAAGKLVMPGELCNHHSSPITPASLPLQEA